MQVAQLSSAVQTVDSEAAFLLRGNMLAGARRSLSSKGLYTSRWLTGLKPTMAVAQSGKPVAPAPTLQDGQLCRHLAACGSPVTRALRAASIPRPLPVGAPGRVRWADVRGVRTVASAQATDTADKKADAVTGAAEVTIRPEDLPTNENSERLLRIRHTCAHVMAMAVQKLYPKAQVTIGPWIERGFYYDFDLEEPLTDKDLKKIEKQMASIIRKNLPLRREEVSREEAARRIQAINEPYKLEILEGLKEPITLYHIGDEWWDLCAGPHVASTGELSPSAIQLESVAGAYWRGDEKKAMLQRVYGTAWETPEQLVAYQKLKEEAKRRDHRKIGADLGLYSIQEDVGGGLVFWHPRGALMRHLIEDYWKGVHLASGYNLVYSPHIAKRDLWRTSGHLDFYAENMFESIDVEEEQYQLRPMNCPFHIAVYKDSAHSYRELPVRMAELGTVYRYERSGTMHGLFRVRGFTQDDGHIFCLPSQVSSEILGVLNLVETILGAFEFTKFEVNLSTRPEKSVGSDAIWQLATDALIDALKTKGWAYTEDVGGGAFYGPKIDIKIRDAIGRLWQCSTIQVDFNLPERFQLEYMDQSSAMQRPIMIHRAIFGSLERFFGVITENYAGDFPLWLSQVQLRLLPVTAEQEAYCHDVVNKVKAQGIRAEVASGERLAKLIRTAEKSKIPIMGVVGPAEVANGTVTLRTRKQGDLGALTIDDMVRMIKDAVDKKIVV